MGDVLRFIITNDAFDPDSVPFLKGSYEVIREDGFEIYEVSPHFSEKLSVLEEAGLIRIISTPTHVLRYVVRDFDSFNEEIKKNKHNPTPILDNIGGFESEEEDWIIDMLEKGIIELRPDSYNPLENGKKCAVGIDNFDELSDLITKVEKKDGDPVIFYIYIGDSKIPFTGAEINSLSKWRSKLVEKNIVINHTKETSWKYFDEFLLNLLERGEVSWVDEESEEEILGNIVLSEVEKLVVVQSREDFLRNPVGCLHENGCKIVKSSTILDIIRRKDLRVSLRQIREILRPYLAKSSCQIRIKNKRVSVWFFKDEGGDEDGKI